MVPANQMARNKLGLSSIIALRYTDQCIYMYNSLVKDWRFTKFYLIRAYLFVLDS